jgi:hypothetical protein
MIRKTLLFIFLVFSLSGYSQSSTILVNKAFASRLTSIYGLPVKQLLENEVNDNLLFLNTSKSQLKELDNNGIKYNILYKVGKKSTNGTSLKNGSPEIINCYISGKLEENQEITIYLEGKNIGTNTGDEGYLTLSLPDFSNVISYGSTLKHSEKVAKGGTIYTSNGTTTTAQYVVIDGYQTGWYSNQQGKVWAKVKLYKSGRYYIHAKMNIGNARYPSSNQGYSGDQQGWPVLRYYFDVKVSIHNDFWISSPSLSTYTAYPGQSLTASCKQYYNGNSTSTLYPKVGCYLSTNSTLSSDDHLLGYEGSSLSSSDTYDYEHISITIPKNTSPGTYYILFVADYRNEYNTILKFKIDIDPSNLYSNTAIYAKDLGICFQGKNFSTNLFDFNVPNTDLAMSGAMLSIKDHRYYAGVYGGQNYLYRNSMGPNLNSGGIFVNHSSGNQMFSLRYSEFNNDYTDYFRFNNKKNKELILGYNFMGDKFNNNTNIYFTKSEELPVFLTSQNWQFGMDSTLEWERRLWGTILNLKYASKDFQREESTDINDVKGASLNLYRLLSERTKLYSNFSYYNHHANQTNDFNYNIGVCDYFHFHQNIRN